MSTSSSSVPNHLWPKLLAPLCLIDAIRLESTNKIISKTIFTHQRRFVWNLKFRDYLFYHYHISRSPENVDKFFAGVFSKIGPNCAKCILKVFRMPTNHAAIFPLLTQLQSIYLQARFESDNWKQFFSSPRNLPLSTLREMRICVVKIGDKYPPSKCRDFLRVWTPVLKSVQLWRFEMACAKQLLDVPNLDKLYLLCNEDTMPLLSQLALKYQKKLTRLQLKWEADEIDPQFVDAFGDAMQTFSTLQALSLEIQWTTFLNETQQDKSAFLISWIRFCPKVCQTLTKLSLDVQNSNFVPIVSNSDIVFDLTEGRKLTLFRVFADKTIFPLKISSLHIDTLEIVFKNIKVYREFLSYLNREELLPLDRNKNCLLVSTFTSSTLVRTLKLTHCPLLDRSMLLNLASIFTQIEKFHFQALGESTYTPKDQQVEKHLDEFVDQLPQLRVIKFDDAFDKPFDLSSLVVKFVQRAKVNPDKQYALYFHKKIRLVQDSALQLSLTVTNLRVY